MRIPKTSRLTRVSIAVGIFLAVAAYAVYPSFVPQKQNLDGANTGTFELTEVEPTVDEPTKEAIRKEEAPAQSQPVEEQAETPSTEVKTEAAEEGKESNPKAIAADVEEEETPPVVAPSITGTLTNYEKVLKETIKEGTPAQEYKIYEHWCVYSLSDGTTYRYMKTTSKEGHSLSIRVSCPSYDRVPKS